MGKITKHDEQNESTSRKTQAEKGNENDINNKKFETTLKKVRYHVLVNKYSCFLTSRVLALLTTLDFVLLSRLGKNSEK